MSIRAIIWDLEGVLLLNRCGNVPACIAKRLNISVERMAQLFNNSYMERVDKGEFTQKELWNRLLKELNLPQENIKQLNDFFHQDFFIDEEVVSEIRGYKSQYKTALLSNYSDALRPMLSAEWRMDGVFDEIVISCEVRMIKPDPRIYMYTLEKLSCAPEETIFIDDREANVAGAHALGIHAFQFTDRSEMNRKIKEIISQQSTASL